jgi:hypothetical protein
MPGTKNKNQVGNDLVVPSIGKQSFKYCNCALVHEFNNSWCFITKKKTGRTWSKSSKSRAASFFIAEAFELKRRIVDIPNGATCRYLTTL